MQRYDVAIVGLGAMGSSIAAQCARRGMRVVGFERFGRLNDYASFAGRSRMIRAAYYEHASYVPLALRAFSAWRELERESEVRLLHVSGVLMIGRPESRLLEGACASAAAHGVAVEQLDARETTRRFPMFAIEESEYAVFEPGAGFVVPERAVAMFLRRAEAAGATLYFNRAADVEQAGRYAAKVVLCPGAWAHESDPAIPVEVERNVQHWFAPAASGQFQFGRCPAFLVERPGFEHPLYGFPDTGNGIKAAFHGSGAMTHTAQIDRQVHPYDVTPVRRALEQTLPGAAGTHLAGKVCMYELSPDRHFIISPHPRDSNVIVAAGFSGHGFKFAPVIGEIVADMVAGTSPAYDVDFFSLRRFEKQMPLRP